ncbi:MAG TPA: ribose-5-phosphate isomerase RpiA [Ktedonobacterales bacterium]|jgi:ribose 5-phosphate isomerase A
MESSAGGTDDGQLSLKRAAARVAAAQVADGATVGLGSGSTAELVIEELAARVRQGLRMRGVATSERTATLAAGLGIALVALDDVPALDISLDGADEVALPNLDLIKGRGGALLREKLVAAASRFRVIVVDASKVVPALGTRFPVPVEVVRFGWGHTAGRISALGVRPSLRARAADDQAGAGPAPFVTDGGNYVLDCATDSLAQPAALGQALKAQVGVVEHGLFVGMTDRVIAADTDGVRVYDRPH